MRNEFWVNSSKVWKIFTSGIPNLELVFFRFPRGKRGSMVLAKAKTMLANVDWDTTLAYNTIKMVKIKDKRLVSSKLTPCKACLPRFKSLILPILAMYQGILNYTMKLAIIIYVLLTILMSKVSQENAEKLLHTCLHLPLVSNHSLICAPTDVLGL